MKAVSSDLKSSGKGIVDAPVDVEVTNEIVSSAASIISRLTRSANIGSAKLLTGLCAVLMSMSLLFDDGPFPKLPSAR